MKQLKATADERYQHFRLSATNDNYNQKWTEIARITLAGSGEKVLEIIPLGEDDVFQSDARGFLNGVRDILRTRARLESPDIPNWLSKQWVREAFVVFDDTTVILS